MNTIRILHRQIQSLVDSETATTSYAVRTPATAGKPAQAIAIHITRQTSPETPAYCGKYLVSVDERKDEMIVCNSPTSAVRRWAQDSLVKLGVHDDIAHIVVSAAFTELRTALGDWLTLQVAELKD